MRAFLALELSAETRASLADVIARLRPTTSRVKWVDPDLTHLTFKFFADLKPDSVPPLQEAVAGVAGTVAPFHVAVRGLGCFASGDRIRVVWCGLQDPAGALADLERRLEHALEPLGHPREDRPFRPHLTLGRLREPSREPRLREAIAGLADTDLGVERPDHLVLFRSDLTPRGPIYTPQASWSFGGAP